MPNARADIALSPDEMRSFLRGRYSLILVTNGPDGHPHPLPMSYMLGDDDRIYCASFRKTQKITNLKHDPKASLLIETGRIESELKAVMIGATVEILEDPDFVFQTMMKMRSLQSQEDEGFVGAEKIRAIAPKRVILRFTPREVISWDHTKLAEQH